MIEKIDRLMRTLAGGPGIFILLGAAAGLAVAVLIHWIVEAALESRYRENCRFVFDKEEHNENNKN